MGKNVGVRQGDCMAPVLYFLFMIMVFAETLETSKKNWVTR